MNVNDNFLIGDCCIDLMKHTHNYAEITVYYVRMKYSRYWMLFSWVVEMKMRIFEWLVQIVLEQLGLWILVICLGESYKAVGFVEYVTGFSKL